VGIFSRKPKEESVDEIVEVQPIDHADAGPYFGLEHNHHVISSDHIEQGYCERIDYEGDGPRLYPARARARGQGIELLVGNVLYSVADSSIPLFRKAIAYGNGSANVLIRAESGSARMSKVYMRVR
jgi:hypothetical protein